MKTNDERRRLVKGIIWALLGVLFLWQGIGHLEGSSRLIFIILGVLDILYAIKLTYPLWGKKGS